MTQAQLIDDKFEVTGKLDLPTSFEQINAHNLYIANKAYLASIRSGNAHTKNRRNISGGGKKPFAQKGGGRARQGSIRAPQFKGGAVVFGPTNDRNYTQKINKKQKKIALWYALNEKAKENNLFVVDSFDVKSGKTKDAFALLSKIATRDVLVVVDTMDEQTYLAIRNIPFCTIIFASELNSYLASAYTSLIIKKPAFELLVKEA